MSKIIKYNDLDLTSYMEALGNVAGLSALFSDSNIPLLYYRATENIYCSIFNAINLGRADVSVDAKLGNVGVGIKTFIENNRKTFQKVAEFNGQQSLYSELNGIDKVKKISELRNLRLQFTLDSYGLDKMIYHCIVRNEKGIHLYEENMHFINVDNLELLEEKQNMLTFTDGSEMYKFNLSKSTLYKQFNTNEYFASKKIIILSDPLYAIRNLELGGMTPVVIPRILVVPLYSTKPNGEKIVYSKSGLNQWNAGGRKRDNNEVYIPYPKLLREEFDDFFPGADFPFNVTLPNGKVLSMKICQQGGKALMSNPNKALGEWLLRDVLKVEEGHVLTYEELLHYGIDSVVFQKNNNSYEYNLDFKEVGSYEDFLEKSFADEVD